MLVCRFSEVRKRAKPKNGESKRRRTMKTLWIELGDMQMAKLSRG
jgi:hypothetical protein